MRVTATIIIIFNTPPVFIISIIIIIIFFYFILLLFLLLLQQVAVTTTAHTPGSPAVSPMGTPEDRYQYICLVWTGQTRDRRQQIANGGQIDER